MQQEQKTERVPVMWDQATLQKIDDYRFAHRIGSRSEAVRRLVVLALVKNEKGEARS